MVVYTVRMLAELGGPKWLCFATFVMLAVNPSTIVSATLAQKDVYSSVGFVLITLETTYFLLTKRNNVKLYHYIVTFVSVNLLFYRNNGLHLVLVICGALLVWIIAATLTKKHINKCLPAFIVVVLVSLVIGFGFNRYLTKKHNAQNVTTRVLYASTIQQIGRYIALYPDEVSDEELADLQLVLNASKGTYRKKYNPLNFDNLKTYFNLSASPEYLVKYLRVWLKLGMRHPEVYLAASLHQNTLLFDVLHTDVHYYRRISFYMNSKTTNEKSHLYVMKELKNVFSEKRELIPIQERLSDLYYSIANFPIVGLFCNAGFVNLLLFGMLSCAVRTKCGTWFVVALTSFVLLAIIFLGPCIAGNSRYLYPIIWSLPILACALLIQLADQHDVTGDAA